MDKVNVLMCTYKENIGIVRQAVDSIIRQTYKNIELVVVIDNPERKDIVEFLEDLKVTFHIKYILNKKNMGLTRSLNIGLQHCDAPFIARMDADDIALPRRIEMQLNYLITNQCDLVGGFIQLIDEENHVIRNRTNYPTSDASIKRLLLIKNCIPHPTWIYRRELAVALQGYRDIHSSEDYDFLIRAMLLKAKFGVLPQICLQYRVSRNGITQNNLALQKILAGKICSQYKNRQIYPISEITEYISQNRKKLHQKERFYHCIKMRDRSIAEVLNILFSVDLIMELRERVAEKIIIMYDKHI